MSLSFTQVAWGGPKVVLVFIYSHSGTLERGFGNKLVIGRVVYNQGLRTPKRDNVDMRLIFKAVISITTVGLISWGSIVGHSEWSAYQQVKEANMAKGATHNELISALEVINIPVFRCSFPRDQAVNKAQMITGLGYSEVVEMAANHARDQGVPVHAYDEEEIRVLR